MRPQDAEHRKSFVGLNSGKTSVVTVSFRPHKEPYDYNKMEGGGIERYKMLFPIGMQFRTVGEDYEVGWHSRRLHSKIHAWRHG